MSETTAFVLCTIILVSLGLFMPYVNELITGNSIDNNIDDLAGVEDAGTSFSDFAGSMLQAFFWYYGELNLVGNAVKIIINFIWAYLLIRLVRGGG